MILLILLGGLLLTFPLFVGAYWLAARGRIIRDVQHSLVKIRTMTIKKLEAVKSKHRHRNMVRLSKLMRDTYTDLKS